MQSDIHLPNNFVYNICTFVFQDECELVYSLGLINLFI